MAQRWDVFVSYAHEDEAWVRMLAENLHRSGRDVFFDRWEVVGGDRLSQRLQQGLAASNVAVLVVSRVAVNKQWEEDLCTETLTWLSPQSAATAALTHQLGLIAQERGDYAQAEQRYQASLTICEELGNRAGIATATGQLGALRTEQGRPADGIPYTISALVIHRELESPEVSIDIFWLAKQRPEVGEEGFAEILSNLLDADSARFVIDAVNTMEQ